MKNRKRDARLLMLFAVLAALPLMIWACDAGDGPGGPTGPATQYNPNSDYPGATITAVANTSSVAPGGEFDIIATFKDANGLPVQGVPLAVSAESGGALGYFGYNTSPTLTDGSGKASIGVVVSAGCPGGSYRFMIYPVRGPDARGYVGVMVAGEGVATIESVEITTSTATITTGEDAAFEIAAVGVNGCTVEAQYRATGAGFNTTWLPEPPEVNDYFPFTLTPYSTGTLRVYARARCQQTPATWVPATGPATVTVN